MPVRRMESHFIGPSSSLMRKMGDKISSKQMAIEADVPIIPGVDHAVHGLEEVTKIANQVGYPVMLKGFQWWWRTWNAYRSFSRRDAKRICRSKR